MEDHKISKLLNGSTVSKIVTRKSVKLNDISSSQYSIKKNVRFINPMLRSDFCDHSDAYIVTKGRINVIETNNANRRNKKLNFKNYS